MYSIIYQHIKDKFLNFISRQISVTEIRSNTEFQMRLMKQTRLKISCQRNLSNFGALLRPNESCHEAKRLVMLGQMYLSTIEYPKHDSHSAFGHKRLCYSRATLGNFLLNLLYRGISMTKFLTPYQVITRLVLTYNLSLLSF